MAISKEDFVNAVPGKTVFIDFFGRRWDVLQKLNDDIPTFILQPEEGEAEEFSYLDGQGIVDKEVGLIVELNNPKAYATLKKE